MRTVHPLVATLLCSLVVAAGCTGQPTPSGTVQPSAPSSAATPPLTLFPSARQAALYSALSQTRTELGFPGAIVGVWEGGAEWVGTTGTAGPDGRAIARGDHSRIGSITKTFTVTLLLQLVEEGRVTLEDTLASYLPGLPNGDTATLRHLASMTSGITSYTAVDAFTDAYFANPAHVWTVTEIVELIRTTTPQFPAGSKVQYSNSNTVLLGLIIEKVTGKPFATVLQERILDPLGLKNTSFPATASLPAPYLSGITEQGAVEGTTTNATNWSPSFAFTAGQMVSTLDDLHRWADALCTGKGILKPETHQLRLDSLSSTVEGNTSARTYGLGIGLTSGWIGHTGEIPGYNTVLQCNRTTGAVIVVLVNSDVPVGSVNPAVGVFTKTVEVLTR
ncbi:MAG: serine hydrolase domain-containing protein [Micropruina sp.]